jgi:hypothetical protein
MWYCHLTITLSSTLAPLSITSSWLASSPTLTMPIANYLVFSSSSSSKRVAYAPTPQKPTAKLWVSHAATLTALRKDYHDQIVSPPYKDPQLGWGSLVRPPQRDPWVSRMLQTPQCSHGSPNHKRQWNALSFEVTWMPRGLPHQFSD